MSGPSLVQDSKRGGGAEDGLLAAQMAGTKDLKCRRIGELEEIAMFRSSEKELDMLVKGVSEMVSDGSAAVRKAVVRFLGKISSQKSFAAAAALEASAFIVASGDAESASVVALDTATEVLKKYSKMRQNDYLSILARDRLLKANGRAGVRFLAVLTIRDADADADLYEAATDQKKPKASAETKASVAALAAFLPRVVSESSQDLEEYTLMQIQFLVSAPRRMAIVHRELVSVLIAKLEEAPSPQAIATALSALYAAESARIRFGLSGLLAAGANRLEAALRRVEDTHASDTTDAVLEAARSGAPMPSPQPQVPLPPSGLDPVDLNRLAIELIAHSEKEKNVSSDVSQEPLDILCRRLREIRAETARPIDPRRRTVKKETRAYEDDDEVPEDRKRKFSDTENEQTEDEEQLKKRRRRILTQVSPDQAGSYEKESGVTAFALSDLGADSIREALCAKLADLEPTEDAERIIRDMVLARLERYELAVEIIDNEDMRTNEARFVASRFKARSESALAMLYECYATERPELYDALLEGLLEAILVDEELNVDKNEFAEMLCSAPRLPDAAIDLLVTLTCVREPNPEMKENALRSLKAKRVGLGLLSLREMALQRPANRAVLCTALLQLTRRPDVDQQVRDKATRLACNQLFPVVALQDYVLHFARENAFNAARVSNEASPEDIAMSVDDARRELGLIVPLCVKHLDLLPELVELVANFDNAEHPMRQALDAELSRLAPALAAAHGAEAAIKSLLGPVVAATKNAAAVDALVGKILLVLAERGSSVRGPGLWTGASALYEALLGLDAKRAAHLVASALDDADASGFRHVLPTLLQQIEDDATLSAALKRAATSAPFDARGESPMSASGVVEALHALEPDNPVPMKRITDALTVCLKAKDTFGALALREAIDRMTDTSKASKALPALLLRATILALKMYPSQLAAFVANNVLTRLATHFTIWTNPPLWRGFIMLCTMLCEENAPNCFDALVALPAPQLTTVLKSSDKGAKLKLMLKRHAEKLVKANRLAIAAPVLRLLGVKAPSS